MQQLALHSACSDQKCESICDVCDHYYYCSAAGYCDDSRMIVVPVVVELRLTSATAATIAAATV
jgi:hypothetical protein